MTQARTTPAADTSANLAAAEVMQRDSARDAEAETGSLGTLAGVQLGPPDDFYEREADQISERVVAGGPVTAPLGDGISRLQRQFGETDEDEMIQSTPAPIHRQIEQDEEHAIQSKSAPGPATPLPAAIPAAVQAIAAGGQPLGRAERAFFEPRFGRDLSSVRLHTDFSAARGAVGIGARAYTLRNHIAFAPGQFDPHSIEGRRLIAHELTHTLQQGTLAKRMQRDGGGPEQEGQQDPQITFNFDPAMAIPTTSGGVTGLTASTDLEPPVTWSIAATTGTKAAGTEIDQHGAITLDGAQTGAVLEVTAQNSSHILTASFGTASVPTGIDRTAVDSDLGSATLYGAAFQHTFTSAQGSADVLTNLRIGEKFPNLATPNAATHRIAGNDWPFGRGHDHFDLQTGTLANDAAGAWVLDSSGQFSPPPAGSGLAQGDNVTSPKWDATTGGGIKVGDHVQSHSNPQPRNRLPVTLTVDQEFHYYNPRAASGSRWTRFTTTAHSRTLRRSGTDIEFVTTVNGIEHVEDYDGPPALTNLSATPVSTPKSQGPPSGGGAAPSPRTVSLSVEMLPDSLPTGMTVTWRFIGNDLGCQLQPDASDPTSAELTIGTQAGTVTIEVATSAGGSADRVLVRIT